MMKRKELCYAKINGKWRLANFIDSYDYKEANRVQIGDSEWIVKRDEVCTVAQHLEIIKS